MARMLRDWTDSENVHKLSADGERFFTRLIMKADDFGRYVADTRLLRASLFPLYDKMKDEKISSWLSEIVDAKLVFCYEVGGKKYLEIKGFDQKLKVRRSKYPPSSTDEREELQMGYVYVIGVDIRSPVKIGFSANPWARLKEIASNHPEHISVLASFKAEKRTESTLHKILKPFRTKNEWFSITNSVFEYIESHSNGSISIDELMDSLRSISSLLRSSPEVEEELNSKQELETKLKEPPSTNSFTERFFSETAEYDREQICIQVNEKEIKRRWVEVFNAHLGTEQKKHAEYNDWLKHFRSWLIKKVVDLKKGDLVQGQQTKTRKILT